MNIRNIILVIYSFHFACSNDPEPKPKGIDMYEKCLNTIYGDCNHQTVFTDKELENAKNFIQKRFLSLKEYRPLRPPCAKLHVRRDFKCLSHEERVEVMVVLKKLYEMGVMTELAEIHWRYWGEIHKFSDFFLWHRWFLLELEKRMRLINPKITLPYWSNFEEFQFPHQSLIWDYFGEPGNRRNGYCIRGGFLSNMTRCIRRQWVHNQYIQSWNPIEYLDSVIQTAHTLKDWFTLLNSPHFKVHLNIGGWMGQMSLTDAPYDAIFFPFHQWLMGTPFLKWQLQSNVNLVPESYNDGLVFDWMTKKIRSADLRRDRLIHFNVSVLEVLQVGFGQLCYVNDNIVEAINQLMRKEKIAFPPNYANLPGYLLQKYYPKFYSNNYTSLDFVTNPVMNCNRRCRPIDQTIDFDCSLNGKRLIRLYKSTAGLDLSEEVKDIEFEPNEFIVDMNTGGYCSPYIMS